MNVVHARPGPDLIQVPCCGATVFQLDALDKISNVSWRVTCGIPVSQWPRKTSPPEG